jgi:hypothetical protein
LRICRVCSSRPRPKPSTPALLEMTVRSLTPLSRSASIRAASGMPHRPKPPHELALAEHLPRHPPLGAERRDEADQHDQPRIDHQLRHLGHAADVLHPVLVGEAQVLVQAVADVVAVQDVGVVAHRQQLLLHQVGDGRLARAGQAGEPHAARAWCLIRARAALSTSTCCQWMLPARRRAKSRVPAATVALVWRSIRMKAPSSRFSAYASNGDRLVEVEVAVGDLVEVQVLGRQVVLGVDVDLVLDLGDLRADGAAADLQPVRAAGQQRLVVHPQQVRGELVGDLPADWRRRRSRRRGWRRPRPRGSA